MENLKKILKYYLPIIMIATGVSFTLVFESWPMKITGAALCVLGTAILFAHVLRLLNIKKEKDKKIEKLDRNITNLTGQLNGKNQENGSSEKQPQSHPATLPDLSGELSLKERIQIFQSYFCNENEENKELFNKNNNLNADYRLFFAQLKRAAIYLALCKDINDNYTAHMLKKVEPQDFELDDNSSQVLLGKLVQLALVAIDYTQEFHTDGNEGYDSLAIKMAAGIISHDEAIEKANRISLNINKTKQTIRTLYKLVQRLGLEDKALIVNDTLLQEEQQEEQ